MPGVDASKLLRCRSECGFKVTMSYPASIVANAVLQHAWGRGMSVDHMKLQKLVFFVHAWHLALAGSDGAVAEPVEAWKHGPVFASLYHRLKQYGRAPVDQYLSDLDPVTGELKPMVPSQQDGQFWRVFEQVMERYEHFNALQLSALSHESGGPWEQARSKLQGQIPNESIRQHYISQLAHHVDAPRAAFQPPVFAA